MIAAWWGKRSWGEKAFIIVMSPGLLLIAVAIVMGSMRAMGILPPSTSDVHITPYADRSKFDKRACWWRETERRYGKVNYIDLSDDAQFQIMRECSRQANEFYGINQ